MIINKFIIIATDNKVERLSNQFGEFLESFKSLSEQLTNRTNNDNTDLVTEDLKKSLKDSIRRNLFIHDYTCSPNYFNTVIKGVTHVIKGCYTYVLIIKCHN